jgi:hypothetical protein
MCLANRNFKASVFAHLFGEPEKELELYNAFAEVRFPAGTPVVDLTLTEALFMDRINDLSFSVGGKLVVFFEHQSSVNDNVAMRYLIYSGRVYEKLIDSKAIYSQRLVTIPAPEFYVLYNGVAPYPENKIYRLSDSYARRTDREEQLELIVKVFNINRGFNEEIVKRSDNLYGYITLVDKARAFEQSGLKLAEALKMAVNECINLGILADYLKYNASEVINMLTREWKIEEAKVVWQDEAREQSDLEWQAVLAKKDTELAMKDAEMAEKTEQAMVKSKVEVYYLDLKLTPAEIGNKLKITEAEVTKIIEGLKLSV